MDLSNIPLGVDFAKFVNDAVVQCDALLAVIGWIDAKGALTHGLWEMGNDS
jgi:hypothetical protein